MGVAATARAKRRVDRREGANMFVSGEVEGLRHSRALDMLCRLRCGGGRDASQQDQCHIHGPWAVEYYADSDTRFRSMS